MGAGGVGVAEVLEPPAGCQGWLLFLSGFLSPPPNATKKERANSAYQKVVDIYIGMDKVAKRFRRGHRPRRGLGRSLVNVCGDILKHMGGRTPASADVRWLGF